MSDLRLSIFQCLARPNYDQIQIVKLDERTPDSSNALRFFFIIRIRLVY
jgi:hypothetical protein